MGPRQGRGGVAGGAALDILVLLLIFADVVVAVGGGGEPQVAEQGLGRQAVQEPSGRKPGPSARGTILSSLRLMSLVLRRTPNPS